jgi:VanZ family protein
VISGKAFSGQNTSAITKPIIHWLLPEMSATNVNMIQQLLRKFGHVIEYYVLGLLLFHAFRKFSGGVQPWRQTIPAVIVLLLCAVGDELHQFFVSGRHALVVDVGIDTVSGVIALMVSTLRRRRVDIQESDRRDVSTKT